MENEEYTTTKTKFESELINFPSEYNKKLGESLLTERLLKYSNNQNHHYEEKENEKIPSFGYMVSSFLGGEKISSSQSAGGGGGVASTIGVPSTTSLAQQQQQPQMLSSRESNYLEKYSKLSNGHDMTTLITDTSNCSSNHIEASRASIKRKADEQENNHYENNDGGGGGMNYLMKYKKQFSNKISSSYASSIPPDLDLPLDIFNEPSVPLVNVPSSAVPSLSSMLSASQIPPLPQPPVVFHPPAAAARSSNINPYAIKDCSDEIKKILKEKIKLNKNGGKLMKGLINELGGQITNEYAQYLGLQPAVKFKCFKCGESQFASLWELKEHQMICLSKSGTMAKSNNNNNSNVNITNNKLNNNSNCKNNSENSNKINKSTNNNNNSNGNSNNNNSSGSNHHNDPSTKIRITRKVFLCSACGTYYENWNLFLHMREVHQRHTCLYCLGLFATSERLLNHLENKHNIKEKVYDSKEQLITSFNNPCYLMCSNCEHVFSEMDNFHSHLCEDYLETCTQCGLKYIHKHNCNSSSSSKAMAVKSTNKLNKDKDKKKLGNNQSLEVNKEKEETQPHHNNTLVNGGNDHFNLHNQQTEHDQQNVQLPEETVKQQYHNILEPPSINYSQPENSVEKEQPQHLPVTSDVNKMDTSLDDANCSRERVTSESSSSSSAEESDTSDDEDDDEEENHHNDNRKNQFPTIVSNIDENLDSNHQQQIVPKLKIKFNSKTFSTPIVSEEESSSADSDEEEEEDVEEEEEEEDEEENDGEHVQEETEKIPISEEPENNQIENTVGSENIPAISPSIKSPPKYNDDDDDRMDIEEPEPIRDLETKEELIKSEVDSNMFNEMAKPSHEIIKLEKSEESEDKPEILQNNEDRDTFTEKKEFEEFVELAAPIDDRNEPADIVKKVDADVTDEQPAMDIDEEIHPKLDETKDSSSIIPFEIPTIKTELLNDDMNDGIMEAPEDSQLFELRLNSPLDKIDIKEFIGICMQSSVPYCLYCNHARRIIVNGKSLALHLISSHRYSATVNSITAEELLPSTIVAKFKSNLDSLDAINFSLESLENCNTVKRDIFAPAKQQFECFQCRFITNIHKELYLHNRKMHLKSILLCIMCKSNFYSYSELICHVCPGTYNKVMILDLVFKCCLCDLDNIPSAFRLMVHLRKKHNACDVCLEECYDQSRLSNHVWKHKLHHLCYRCGIAYRNKPDITKHLFWKHGTESVVCKKCLQKKWPHVYHFCIPPPMFTCETCSLMFHKAVSLKVHKRLHNGDAKYPCTEDNCDKKFISRKLLLKHVDRHSNVVEEIPMLDEEMEYNEEGSGNEHKDENEEGVKSGDEIVDEVEKTKKEKRKKSKVKEEKDNDENVNKVKPVIDIMDLPALNLSESDSSDEEEHDNRSETQFAKTTLDQDNENDVDDPDTNNIAPIMNIWDNFRSFQASQKKPVEDDDREPNIPPPILHVVQSDHDYSMMYRPIKEIQEDIEDEKKMGEEILENSVNEKPSPSKKTQKSSDSSSSDSSSGSDSCSCGTDCSCSSSSSGSSSSSSSSDEGNNSSSSEKRKKLSNAAKEEKIKKMEKKRQKVVTERVTTIAAAAEVNESLQQIDVVATDTKINITVDPDSIILESDLETDESETDEDFYDEHPQKLANQILAEKRRQLMLQTCLNPMNNAIVENSRPSTPSLPEDVVKEKRTKIKKKKKKRNAVMSPVMGISNSLVPPLKISIPAEVAVPSPVLNKSLISPPVLPVANFPTVLDNIVSTPPVGITPALISSISRLSTGSGSETDGTLKRSKRRRIPNRFYGYSSDEESVMSVMKPTPPPNLTWRKEDLPSPTNVKTPPVVKSLKIRSPSLIKTPMAAIKTKSSRNSSPVNLYPPIPPVIIRPSPQATQSPISMILPPIAPPSMLAQPPRVEPLRVPAVPVHHIMPPEFPNSSFSEYSDNSDSDTSNEGGLQILQKPTAPLKTKIILNKTPIATAVAVATTTPRQKKEPATKRQTKTPKPPKTPKTPKTPRALKNNVVSAPPAMNAPLPPPVHHQPLSNPHHHHQIISPQQILPPSQSSQQMPQQYVQQQYQQPAPPPPQPIYQQQQQPVHHPPQPQRLPGIKYPLFLPPRGTRTEPKEGESVYCYCQCPYDEVSEMIACDGEDCQIEWFHFECVGIMVPPKGKWYCPDCKPKYLSGNNEYLEEDNT